MRFEYLVGGLGAGWEAGDEQAQLNECGAQGWELVGVIVKPDSEGRPCTFYYFRRPVHERVVA